MYLTENHCKTELPQVRKWPREKNSARSGYFILSQKIDISKEK